MADEYMRIRGGGWEGDGRGMGGGGEGMGGGGEGMGGGWWEGIVRKDGGRVRIGSVCSPRDSGHVCLCTCGCSVLVCVRSRAKPRTLLGNALAARGRGMPPMPMPADCAGHPPASPAHQTSSSPLGACTASDG